MTYLLILYFTELLEKKLFFVIENNIIFPLLLTYFCYVRVFCLSFLIPNKRDLFKMTYVILRIQHKKF